MPDTEIHPDNDTPKASDGDIKRSDADTHAGLGDSKDQGLGYSPTDPKVASNIQNAPKTPS